MIRDKGRIKKLVIQSYSAAATGSASCFPQISCCASGTPAVSLLDTGRRLGYSDEELKLGLGEANLGLGSRGDTQGHARQIGIR